MTALFAFMSAFISSSQALLAQVTPPQVICTGLPGCVDGTEYGDNVFLQNFLPAGVTLLLQVAAGGAVIFIVIAGVQLLLSFGDEGKVTAGKKAVMYALGGLGLALTSGTIVAFVSSENYGQANPGDFLFGGGGLLQSVISIILVLFNVAFALIIIFSGLRMVISTGNADEFKKAGGAIKWAIVGAVLVNIANALVQAFLVLDL